MSQGPAVTPERLMQMGWAFVPPLILAAGIRNGIFDALADGEKSVADIGALTANSERGLTALLNALAGIGLLTRKDGRYGLTPESAAFLVRNRPRYIGGYFQFVAGEGLQRWMRLPEAVRTGQSPAPLNQEGVGSPFFRDFVEDLFSVNYPAARTLGQELRLGEAGEAARVLDLGAGSGVWGIALAQLSPNIRVAAVDWPDVLEITRRVVARYGLTERYEFRPGDLLEADFGSGYDLATIGHILHSEGEERSRRLLKKTYEALAPGGRIAIADFLVNDDRSGPVQPLFFALNMLVNTDTGSTYSFEEISAWLAAAGFTGMHTLAAPSPSPLILARRP